MSEASKQGKIVQIIGAVLDVEFDRNSIPAIFKHLKSTKPA